jgi:hypothetical protein
MGLRHASAGRTATTGHEMDDTILNQTGTFLTRFWYSNQGT